MGCCSCDAGQSPSPSTPAEEPLMDCTDAICSMDVCPDGMGRRQVGTQCCSCEVVLNSSAPAKQTDCSETACSMDVCPDGRGRRQVGDNCCACVDSLTQTDSFSPAPAEKETMSCAEVVCTTDV